MKEPKRLQLKPQFAEAMRFLGWENAAEIHMWCKKVFYVGRGHQHVLRRENEFDRSNGHILENAVPYLALETSDEGWVRVDIGEWIVLGGSDGMDLGKMTQEQLDKFYTDPTGE